MTRNILIFTLILGLASCDEINPSDGDQVTDPVSYSLMYENHREVEPDCNQEECTYVEVSIPILMGGDTAFVDEINAKIDAHFRGMMKNSLPEPRSSGSWESLCESFIEGYELFETEFPDSEAKWYMELKGDSSEVVGEFFTLLIRQSEFLGGAHPNHRYLLESYHLLTGDKVNWSERVDMEKLKTLAERKFREFHELSPDQDLTDEGFMFPEGGFVLPENMGLTKDGLTLIYNPYEVASYAAGITMLEIPLDSVKIDKPAV